MPHDRRIRIFMLGEEGIGRECLARVLSSSPGVGAVAQCSTVSETICTLSPLPPDAFPDVVLVDHEEETSKHLGELVQWAQRQECAGNILLLTAGVHETLAAWLKQKGVGGLIHKRNSLQNLLEAVGVVASGGTWREAPHIRVDLKEAARPRKEKPLFSEREVHALRALIEGCSNKEIGARMGRSESSAKGLLQRLFQKTRVRTRGQLIRVALEKHRHLL